MQKELAIKLKATAEKVAERFSSPDRQFNTTKEIFTVDKIVPLSDMTAVIILKKNSGKLGLCFAYYIKADGGKWCYFFPTDSHLLGIKRLEEYKYAVEKYNYSKNFEE